jgi:hypothetical protein
MPEPRFTVGQRVASILPTSKPIEGYVRGILPHADVFIIRVALDDAPQHQRWIWHLETQWKPAVGTVPVYRKCSDIPDLLFLEAIEACRHARPTSTGEPAYWATRWDVAAYLASDWNRIGGTPDDYAQIPENLILAKIRRLDRRRVISGCGCGCRGDLEVADKGRQMLREHPDTQRDARIAAAGQHAKPGPTLAELSAKLSAGMTPVQRAIADAQTDLMLYGEATIPATWPIGVLGALPGDPVPAHVEGLMDVLEALPGGEEVVRVINANLARAAEGYATALTPTPQPKPGRFLDGCRKVDGTIIHGRPHTCPPWMRG